MTNGASGQTPDLRLQAFADLVTAYEEALLRYAAYILRNADAAQDVVQDAFIRLHRGWREDFCASPSMSAWLYRTVHNLAVDWIRKEARRAHHHQQHAAEHPPDPAYMDSAQARTISDDAEEAVAALETLVLRDRQLVILKIYEEKSYKEIAEITGLTTTNIGYILHMAMKKLAAELQRRRAAHKPPGERTNP